MSLQGLRGASFRIWFLAPLLFLLSCTSGEYVDQGSVAPDFSLLRSDGNGTVALSQLRGKVVLLNFWATWCPPCVREMPALQRLHEKLAGDDFVVIAISVDEDPEEVADFVARRGLTFPILLDPDHKIANLYQTIKYPETFLIDRNGIVAVSRFAGDRDWDKDVWVSAIREVIEKSQTHK